MAVSGSASVNVNLLKRLWGNNVPTPVYKASKAIAFCKKDRDFGSEGRYVVVSVAPPGGGSADFSEAVANQSATTEVRFFVQPKNEYQVWSIQNDAIMRSQGDKNAMVELVKHYLGRARYAYARALARRFWGNRGGAAGQIAAAQNLALAVMTLRVRGNAAAFEIGQWYQFASTDGTGTAAAYPTDLRDNAKKLQVISIDRIAGTVTFNAALNTVGGITANDFVFRAGDYAQARTGAQGWGPIANPSASENFFGVDRTATDMQRTSGARYSGSGQDKITTLIEACAEGQNVGIGGETTSGFRCFMHPLDFKDFQKDKESVREITAEASEAKIGMKGLSIATALGDIEIFSETDVLQGSAWILSTDEVYERTKGDSPMDLIGGSGLLIYPDQDKRQGRIGSYGNFFWENPGNQIIANF